MSLPRGAIDQDPANRQEIKLMASIKAISRKTPDLNRFEPVLPLAKVKATELIRQGGRLVSVTRTEVRIRRMHHIAIVDKDGRISWQPF